MLVTDSRAARRNSADRMSVLHPRRLVAGLAALLFAGIASAQVQITPFGTTDAATGIDPGTITYTHAVDFNAGGTPANINGLAFYNDTNRSGPGYSLVNPTASFTGYNSPASNSSQLEGLMARFWYGDDNVRLTLSGLTPGQTYKVRFFIGGYQGQTQTFRTDQGFSEAGVDRGIGGTIAAIEHTYTLGAGDSDISFTFTKENNGTFHWYGFTNELVDETAVADTGDWGPVIDWPHIAISAAARYLPVWALLVRLWGNNKNTVTAG